jgi:putative flippase GtrA
MRVTSPTHLETGSLITIGAVRDATKSAAWRQITSFALIGVASTLAYVALYAVLRGGLSAALANAVALLVTAVGNTAANRRMTFGVRGRDGLGRHHVAGIIAFAIALAITSASIALLQALVARPGRLLEIAVLVGANVLATIIRFLVLRSWIKRGPVVDAAEMSSAA